MTLCTIVIWAPSSEFVSSSIPSRQILTAHAQPFRGARDLAFCLKVPLDSLLVWASSEGSGETARMRRLAWTFAARIGYKYQIRLTRSIWRLCFYKLTNPKFTIAVPWNIDRTSVKLMSHLRKITKWKWQKLAAGLNPNHMQSSNHGKKDVQSCIKISMKLYKELRLQCNHCLYTFIESEVRKWQSSQSGKSSNNSFKDYIQTTCISPDHGKNICKVS